MKSSRFLACAALIATLSVSLQLSAQMEGRAIGGGRQELSEEAGADSNDSSITSRIRTAFAINPVTKNSTIHVETEKGVVNLTGEVPNSAVVREAQKIAQNAGHVKSVRNNLRVENVSNSSSQM